MFKYVTRVWTNEIQSHQIKWKAASILGWESATTTMASTNDDVTIEMNRVVQRLTKQSTADVGPSTVSNGSDLVAD